MKVDVWWLKYKVRSKIWKLCFKLEDEVILQCHYSKVDLKVAHYEVKVEAGVWIWSLKLKFEVDVWSWSLKLKFEVGVWR